LSKYIIVVVRVGGHGDKTLMDAAPCKHCLERLQSYGFNKIVYSNNRGNIVVDHLKNMKSNHLSDVQKRMLNLSLPVYIPTVLQNNNNNHFKSFHSSNCHTMNSHTMNSHTMNSQSINSKSIISHGISV
jgi:hypothetical protein